MHRLLFLAFAWTTVLIKKVFGCNGRLYILFMLDVGN